MRIEFPCPWWKVQLTKKERKGKTYLECQELRKRIHDDQLNAWREQVGFKKEEMPKNLEEGEK